MKLLLDAMLPGKLVAPLRERGLDVKAIDGDPELAGLSDDRVMEWGRAESRVIVTRNVDHFRQRGHRAIVDGVGHAGLILLPGHGGGIGWLISELDQLSSESPGEDDLRNREIWL